MAAGRHNLTRRSVLGAGAAVTLVAAAGTGGPSAPAETAAPAKPRRAASPRIDIVCAECGGANVSRDAWADWDAEAQNWVLGAVFDYAHCHDCGGETNLEEVPLWPQDSPTG